MKIKPFEKKNVTWKCERGLAHSIEVRLDEDGTLEVTTRKSAVGADWGIGWGSRFEPEEVVILQGILSKIEVVEGKKECP